MTDSVESVDMGDEWECINGIFVLRNEDEKKKIEKTGKFSHLDWDCVHFRSDYENSLGFWVFSLHREASEMISIWKCFSFGKNLKKNLEKNIT